MSNFFDRAVSLAKYWFKGDVQSLSHCPECGSAWLYTHNVRDLENHSYKEKTFTRLLSVYDTRVDATVAFRCPDCLSEWRRK